MSNMTRLPATPQLLAPAGSFEKLETAIHYGADAVYLGGPHYGLRAGARNFDETEIEEAIVYAHDHGVKVYLTVNIFAHNRDFKGLARYLKILQSAGADGVIVSDPGVLMVARTVIPQMPIHLSTQANVTNDRSAGFWASQGIERLNLARELSGEEIKAIRAVTDVDLEVFVHGALCISYSGRCLLSTYLTGRDANQGQCAQPCRYRFTLLEEKRPGEHFRVEEDDRNTYLFNAKDLCLLRKLPILMAIGINALKIEGRMKSIFYVGGVVRVYRAALDYLSTLDRAAWHDPGAIELPAEYLQEIERIGTRGMSENFFDGPPDATTMCYDSARLDQSFEPVAVVRETGVTPVVEIRTAVQQHEQLEYMDTRINTVALQLAAMYDQTGQELSRANPGTVVRLVLKQTAQVFTKHSMFRRRKTARS